MADHRGEVAAIELIQLPEIRVLATRYVVTQGKNKHTIIVDRAFKARPWSDYVATSVGITRRISAPNMQHEIADHQRGSNPSGAFEILVLPGSATVLRT